MTNEPSPRPWRVEQMFNGVADARGEKVAANIRAVDAALIVAAVNKHGMPIVELIKAYDELEAERDRLRDLVWRLAHVAQDALNLAEAMCDTFGDNPERAKARSEVEALLREAREAIGEDKP